MESMISIFMVSILFFLWLPLFLSTPGSKGNGFRYEYFRRIVLLRKWFRAFRSGDLDQESHSLRKTG